MTIKQTLEHDLKAAMRSGDVTRRSVIRLLRSEIHNQEIADRAALDDEATLRLLGRQAQQRRDSIEAFETAHRADLVQKEKAELAVIMEYLPAQMSADELAETVRAAIAQTGAAGPRDVGKVMGAVMPKVRGRADGREVNRLASDLLRAMSA